MTYAYNLKDAANLVKAIKAGKTVKLSECSAEAAFAIQEAGCRIHPTESVFLWPSQQ